VIKEERDSKAKRVNLKGKGNQRGIQKRGGGWLRPDCCKIKPSMFHKGEKATNRNRLESLGQKLGGLQFTKREEIRKKNGGRV